MLPSCWRQSLLHQKDAQEIVTAVAIVEERLLEGYWTAVLGLDPRRVLHEKSVRLREISENDPDTL
jgi:hypothetical protein